VSARNWYYLSEMAVSNLHGGGLTVQRVLGDDLARFAAFVHVSEFATGKYRMADDFGARQVNLHQLLPRPDVVPDSLGYYIERVLLRMKRVGIHAMSPERWARRCARYLTRNVDVEGSRWLIVPQDVTSVRVANGVFRRRRMHYVTWVMDDHVIRWEDGWRYPPGFEKAFGFHLRHARRVFVISPPMARLYKERFGVDAEVLFGPADPVGAPVGQSPHEGGPVRLGYFGAVSPWQQDALERLVLHLEGVGAVLDIFTFDGAARSLAGARVGVHPPLPPAEVIHRMRDYDGVVIPVSFKPERRHLTELNISTKMSECLASGTVTVIVGPDYAAMSQFARAHGGMIVINDFEDPSQLERLASLKDRGSRTELLARARRVVEDVCSVNRMRRTWRAEGGGSGEPWWSEARTVASADRG
jgi:hypothetical protein